MTEAAIAASWPRPTAGGSCQAAGDPPGRRLVPGEPIVLVLAAAPHVRRALDATAFLIDWAEDPGAVLEEGRFSPTAMKPGWKRAQRTMLRARAGATSA